MNKWAAIAIAGIWISTGVISVSSHDGLATIVTVGLATFATFPIVLAAFMNNPNKAD